MNSLTLQIEKKHTEEIKIPVPCFWKKDYSILGNGEIHHMAILNETTAIYLTAANDEIKIHNTTPKKLDGLLLHAHSEWDLTTEQDFMNAYDDAWEAIRLRPQLEERYEPDEKEIELNRIAKQNCNGLKIG